MNKADYEMALSVLKTLETKQNTPHIMIVISFAKAAVKKQIPKKPDYYNDKEYAKCPSCGVTHMWGCKFCSDCGQALDWSDNK